MEWTQRKRWEREGPRKCTFPTAAGWTFWNSMNTEILFEDMPARMVVTAGIRIEDYWISVFIVTTPVWLISCIRFFPFSLHFRCAFSFLRTRSPFSLTRVFLFCTWQAPLSTHFYRSILVYFVGPFSSHENSLFLLMYSTHSFYCFEFWFWHSTEVIHRSIAIHFSSECKQLWNAQCFSLAARWKIARRVFFELDKYHAS